MCCRSMIPGADEVDLILNALKLALFKCCHNFVFSSELEFDAT